MKDLFNQISNGLGGLGGLGDKLNGALGGQQKADAPSGQGTGNALGDMVKSAGGLGGLLGSAALGGLLGTLMSGKTARKVAKGALMVGGTAAVGALAWKFYQKWSGPTGATRRTGPVSPARTERLARRAAANAAPGCFGGSDGPVVAGGDGFRRPCRRTHRRQGTGQYPQCRGIVVPGPGYGAGSGYAAEQAARSCLAGVPHSQPRRSP